MPPSSSNIFTDNAAPIYQSLLNSPGLSLLIISGDEKIEHANEAACRLFSRSLPELLETDTRLLFTGAVKESSQSSVMAILKSGELVDCDAYSLPFTATDGCPKKCVVLIDSRERQLVDLRSKMVFENFNLLLDNTDESFILVDFDLRIVMYNRVASIRTKQIMGFDLYPGMPVLDIANPERRDLVKKIYERVLKGETFETEVELMLSDGSPYIVQNKFHPARKKNEEIVGVMVNVIDITEKALSQRKLKESNERFEYAARATSDVFWEWDIINERVYRSPAFADILGYEIPSDQPFYACHEKIHPEDRDKTLAEFYYSLDNKYIDRWQKEYRLQRADGTYAYLNDRAHIIRNEEGKAIRVIGALQDISSQKEILVELERVNERYSLATRASFDAIWDADLKKQTIQWGEGFETLFGYKKSNVDGSSWSGNIHPDDKELVIQRHEEIIAGSSTFWQDEYRFIRADGSIADVIDRGIILRDENGIAYRIVGAMQDITELKNKERELTISNERFKFASEATSAAIADEDIIGGTVLWDENFAKIFGHPVPAGVHISIQEIIQFVHPDDLTDFASSRVNTFANKNLSKWDHEFRLRKSNGEYVFVKTNTTILRDKNGKPFRVIGSLRDISEKRYQEELRTLELKVYQSSVTQDYPFNKVVDELLMGFEQLHPGMFCSVFLADENFRITPFSAPTLPAGYINMLNGFVLGVDDGSCGRSMHTRSPVIVSDIETDPLCEKYRDVYTEFGLRSCWSIPLIHGNGNIMGSFAMYYKEVRLPSDSEWHTVLRVHNLLRMLMENHKAVEQLRISNERYDIVAKATHDLVWDWNLETGELYRDPEGLKKVYGISDNDSIRHINQWLTHIHPDDVLHAQQVIYNILAAEDETNFDVEYRFRREDGTYSHIYDRGMIMREDGKPKRMIGAAQDISVRKKLEEELVKQEVNRQKVITQAIIDTQESERAEMGKELHDNVNQLLTTTKLYLDLAKTNEELKDELICKSSDNILYIINEIRKISKTLMLPSLGDLGLIDSLHDLAENLNVTQKIRVDFTYGTFNEKSIGDNQRLMLLRVTQEALNNIVKHASATHASIVLKQKENEIILTVSDNGSGFALNQSRKGIGLSNIYNRVSLFNGNLKINTAPGKGCNLIVSIPIHQPK